MVKNGKKCRRRGVPFKNFKGRLVGAIGVSGSAVENDHIVAEAGFLHFCLPSGISRLCEITLMDPPFDAFKNNIVHNNISE